MEHNPPLEADSHLGCLQEPVTVPYPALRESSPFCHTLLV